MHADAGDAPGQAARAATARCLSTNEFVAGVSRRVQLVCRSCAVRWSATNSCRSSSRCSTAHGAWSALEALVRWQHPERGLLLPRRVHPRREESGLIVELGRRVLRRGLRATTRLLADAGLPPLRIAVNVSPRAVQRRLVHDVADSAATTSPAAGRARARDHRRPADAGPGARDRADAADRGAGRELLDRRLRHRLFEPGLPQALPDRPPEDRPLVRARPRLDEDDAAICKSIIALAHALRHPHRGRRRGTSMQLDWLRARHIDEVQGYLLARPMPFAELLPLLSRCVDRVASRPEGEVRSRADRCGCGVRRASACGFEPQDVARRAGQERRRPAGHPVRVPRAPERRKRVPALSARHLRDPVGLVARRHHHPLGRAEIGRRRARRGESPSSGSRGMHSTGRANGIARASGWQIAAVLRSPQVRSRSAPRYASAPRTSFAASSNSASHEAKRGSAGAPGAV